MTYKVILKDYKTIYDEREVSTDDELMKTIGLFSCWYFLAIDVVDYMDAYGTRSPKDCPVDTLLAFTCDKVTDKPNGPHRHGAPTGKLAFGKAWFNGVETEVDLWIERKEN